MIDEVTGRNIARKILLLVFMNAPGTYSVGRHLGSVAMVIPHHSLSLCWPGGDTFALKMAIVPVRTGQRQWAVALIFFHAKAIQMLDSRESNGGDDGLVYLEHILHFLQDQYMAKKGEALQTPTTLVFTPSRMRISTARAATQSSSPKLWLLCVCGSASPSCTSGSVSRLVRSVIASLHNRNLSVYVVLTGDARR
jgi:hypothetical protein